MQIKFSASVPRPAFLLASLFLSFHLQRTEAAMRPNEAFIAYSLSNNFGIPSIWTVNGGPATLPGASPFISDSIILHTDGAGKITGTGWFWIDYVSAPSAPYTAFFLDVTGKIASSPT